MVRCLSGRFRLYELGYVASGSVNDSFSEGISHDYLHGFPHTCWKYCIRRCSTQCDYFQRTDEMHLTACIVSHNRSKLYDQCTDFHVLCIIASASLCESPYVVDKFSLLITTFFDSWIISKLVPFKSRTNETLHFLLDHPRRCFIYLFPSHQTWFLLTVLIMLKYAFYILTVSLAYHISQWNRLLLFPSP